MNNLELANPYFLCFLLLIPLVVWRHFRRKTGSVAYSDLSAMESLRKTWRQHISTVSPVFIWLALALIIVGMTRPRLKNAQSSITAEGIDIVMTLDVSRSMLIEDMGDKNRLEAAKEVAEHFVQNRSSDRVGLVLFAGKSFTQCPLTVDYEMLVSLIRQVHIGEIEDGTAIGMGLINAINRLRESKVASRVIILLTDGENNRGEIDPITAAQIAQTLGIRVYTIGAGKDGFARVPVDDPFFGKQYVPLEVKIDEKTLQKIAETTGGQYFRANNKQALEKIYEQIGQLEKTKIEVTKYFKYEELYPPIVLLALALLIIHFLLSITILFRLP